MNFSDFDLDIDPYRERARDNADPVHPGKWLDFGVTLISKSRSGVCVQLNDSDIPPVLLGFSAVVGALLEEDVGRTIVVTLTYAEATTIRWVR